MDPAAQPARDEFDLDALMVRVRDAARGGAQVGAIVQPHAAAEPAGRALDLIRVIEAQGEWNEQTRQLLAALVECLRTLRDDSMDVHARLQQDVRRLSALVTELRTGTAAAAIRSEPRPPGKRRSSKSGKRRS